MTIWLLTYEPHEDEAHPRVIQEGLLQFCKQAELVIARTWVIETAVDEHELGPVIGPIFQGKQVPFVFVQATKLHGSRIAGDFGAIAKMFVPELPDDLPI